MFDLPEESFLAESTASSMTLAEKLDKAISQQQAEVDRLVAVAKEDLPKAQAKLAELQAMAKQVTKELEGAYVTCKALGIRLDDA